MSDGYKTIKGIASAKLVSKKSRFLAEASAVDNRDKVKSFVADVKNRIPQATHYCYAYSIGNEDDKLEYASDAGEPTHSAGPPILNAIHGNELSNIIIVVARYYGGIKLGIGGLIRSYGACARACLENATLETIIKYKELHVDVPYTEIGTVVTLCKRMGGKVKTINYEPNPNILIQIKERQLENIQIQLQSIGITPRY
ncbi:YigZ family protein [Candidatus Poribacteria bacterium]|nr:YigZ family protein [Candidatus Poribacteria bacterium]